MGAYFSQTMPEIRDMTGRVCVVTGANQGIGYHTIKHLAKRGAKVYMGARDGNKARAAIEKLQAEELGEKSGEVIWLDLDLVDPRNAKRAAEYILAHEKRLDILINNAGVMGHPFTLTPDGISDSMVVNHLSPFLFTNLLLPLLTSTTQLPGSDVRIVNVASVVHSWIQDVQFDSLEAFNSDFNSQWMSEVKIYSFTKLANILHAKELQRRLDAASIPIVVISLHPGGVATDTGRAQMKSSLPLGTLWSYIFPLFINTPDQGAWTSLFAATAPAVRADPKYKGVYLEPYDKIVIPSASARDPQLAKDLWATSEQLLADIGIKL